MLNQGRHFRLALERGYRLGLKIIKVTRRRREKFSSFSEQSDQFWAIMSRGSTSSSITLLVFGAEGGDVRANAPPLSTPLASSHQALLFKRLCNDVDL